LAQKADGLAAKGIGEAARVKRLNSSASRLVEGVAAQADAEREHGCVDEEDKRSDPEAEEGEPTAFGCDDPEEAAERADH
jgi:hypothetical protein